MRHKTAMWQIYQAVNII